jgi:hypothetical protein
MERSNKGGKEGMKEGRKEGRKVGRERKKGQVHIFMFKLLEKKNDS